MAFVSVNSGIFRVVKRSIYEYIEQCAQEARDTNREFMKPIIVDHDVQVAVDAIKRRVGGERDAAVQRTQKVNTSKQMFLNRYLDNLDIKQLRKTPVTLRALEQKEFVKDVQNLAKVSHERRQGLMDFIRSGLPLIEGLGLKQAFLSNPAEFVEFHDVSDEDESAKLEE